VVRRKQFRFLQTHFRSATSEFYHQHYGSLGLFLSPFNAFQRVLPNYSSNESNDQPSFRTSRMTNQALVAATDLRASYKSFDMSKFSKGTSAISLTPHISDFIGPIKTPDLKSLHALRDPSNVDGQGIIEWQIKDVLGSIGTIRTHGYLSRPQSVC
jgi:hypothetical protein